MTPEKYKESVSSDQFVLVVLGASWCPYCMATKEVLPEFRRRFPKVAAKFVSVDSSPDVAQALGVKTLPTIVFYANGRAQGRVLGQQGVDGLARLVPRSAR